jgi:hypothetical protein
MGAGTIGAPARPLPQLLPTSNPYLQSTLEVRNSGKWYSNRSKSRPSGNRRLDWVSSIRTKSSKSGGPERNGAQREISGLLGAATVNRSAPKSAVNLPLSGPPGQAESATHSGPGGGGATGFEPSPTCCLENRAKEEPARESCLRSPDLIDSEIEPAPKLKVIDPCNAHGIADVGHLPVRALLLRAGNLTCHHHSVLAS